MFDAKELAKAKTSIAQRIPLTLNEQSQLIDQTIKQLATINNWYGFMSLISRSGSSWSGKIREKLDEYLFDGADAETIAATVALLEKHKHSTVQELLDKLTRLDAPINHSR